MLYAIGHSTHPIDEFVSLLLTHGVDRVVDIMPDGRVVPAVMRDFAVVDGVVTYPAQPSARCMTRQLWKCGPRRAERATMRSTEQGKPT